MSEILDKAKKFLWHIVEILFAFLLVVILIGLILGKDAGSFVQSVMLNVAGFVNSIGSGNLVGIAVVLALLYLAQRKWGQ
ncbi:MAG: hypothetical protein ACREUB_10815 [Burkholderiales bacterium]